MGYHRSLQEKAVVLCWVLWNDGNYEIWRGWKTRLNASKR